MALVDKGDIKKIDKDCKMEQWKVFAKLLKLHKLRLVLETTLKARVYGLTLYFLLAFLLFLDLLVIYLFEGYCILCHYILSFFFLLFAIVLIYRLEELIFPC